MPTVLAVLNQSDIPQAVHLAATCPDAQTVVFDPALLDPALAAGLKAQLCTTWDAAPPYRQRAARAHELARGLGRKLDAICESHQPGLRLGSWQHLGLYYLHMALIWHGGVFAAQLAGLQAERVLVPFEDHPQSYYFPSFVAALLLLQQAHRNGTPFQAYAHASARPPLTAVPDLRGPHTGSGDFVLTHLPTCFYDIDYINAEIGAAGKTVVDVRPRHWGVAVAAAQTRTLVDADAVLAELPGTERDRIETVLHALAAPLDAHLTPWLAAGEFRGRQVRALIDTYRAQLVTLAALEQHFASARPSRLLLSDHDAGLHGPLLAYARRQQVPVLVLPHSKVSGDLDFLAAGATLLTHPMQGHAVLDLDGQRPAQASVDMPCRMAFDSRSHTSVRRVGILLNGVSLNGVANTDWAPYAQGLARLFAWCAEQGLEPVLRSRPGGTLFGPLLEGLGLPRELLLRSTQGSMADFAAGCDLCLMYDTPTSGVLEFLTRGVAVINPVPRELVRNETATVSTTMVPRGGVEAMLALAAGLVADAVEFQQFRKRQFAAFACCYSQALPLRVFL